MFAEFFRQCLGEPDDRRLGGCIRAEARQRSRGTTTRQIDDFAVVIGLEVPDRAAGSLSRKSVRRLQESLRDSLEVAIRNRGSSVDTYRDAWGDMGSQQEELLVYGRAGEPCVTCGRPLAIVRIAGRSTVFCRHCQH